MKTTLFPVVPAVLLAGAAAAQPCDPSWDTTIGAVGLTSDGYAGPMAVHDDGGGEALFIGGSFSSAGGLLTRGLARYGADGSWDDVGGGCYSTNTNYFVAALAAHDFGQGAELVSGGGFGTAGGVAGTANLAAWNGRSWRGLGAPNGAVWSLLSRGTRLYAAGGFTQVGAAAASGIAVWENGAWSPLGSGMSGGFSPNVFVMALFNDGSGEKLYAGGRFASLGGVSGLIARWTGTAWQAVGRGVQGTQTFSDVESMAVHDDGTGPKLYAGGWDIRPVGTSVTVNVVRWDGTRWTAVGQYLGGRTTSLASFDDGTGPAIYAGGTAQPGIAYIARLEAGQWQAVSGGAGQDGGPPWPSVFGLKVWRDQLIVAGDFDYVGSDRREAYGLAAWSSCGGGCPADFNGDGFTDFFDYADYVGCFETGICPPGKSADFNGDGFADFFDYGDFVAAFESGC
jgi:hypothetical protein